MVVDRTARLNLRASRCGGLRVEHRVGSVELIPVAAPDHPLALARSERAGAGREHIQLVLTDRSTLTQGQDLA